MKDESLSLKIKGTESLGLVQNFGISLFLDENIWDNSAPALSHFLQFYSVLSRSYSDLDEKLKTKLS